MERKSRDNSLIESIEPVIEGLGFSLVEFTSSRNRSNLTVNTIIYRESGVNLADCSIVYKTILPRIELLEDSRSVNLEVSSPGLSRNIKAVGEFEIFIGRKVRILKKDDSEWIHGNIVSVENNSVNLNVCKETVIVEFADINKAKLE
ncbi:MAG: ribosome assembly cofactor RimP [Spirochaetota bacterium]|nr:ribosome assembly cofactor RimP [Spirochaetota bacterium]